MISPALFEKVEKISTPYRVLIVLGSLVLLLSVFYFLIWNPLNNKKSQLNTTISRLDKEIRKARAREKGSVKLEAELADMDSQFREALKLLPNEREIPRLLKSITQKGRDSDLQFRLFSPKPERPQNFYVEIPVAVEVSGKYHDVAQFFDEVGRMDRIVNILDVSMKPQKALGINLVTKCTAVTYRFKAGKPGAEKKKKRSTRKARRRKR